MKQTKQMDFVERHNTAAAAKKQLIEKMRQAPKHDDPAVVARRAEKTQAKETNALQRVERNRLKQEAMVQQKTLEEARAAEAANAERAEAAAAAERSASLKAEQKAERDRRYAARKSRQR